MVAVRVALADDSALIRRGLGLLLTAAGVEVAYEAATAEELLAYLRHHTVEAVITDIRMPPTFTDEGIQAARTVRDTYPDVAVLVLSTYAETSNAVRLLEGGSRGMGYLLKDRVDNPDALVDALRRLIARESVIDPDLVTKLVNSERSMVGDLTERERDVLRLMAEGRSNSGIGQTMFLSPKTVESHVAAVYSKLGLPAATDDNRRVLAVLAWLQEGKP